MYTLTITEHFDDYKHTGADTRTLTFETKGEAYEYLSFYIMREVDCREGADYYEFEDIQFLVEGDYEGFADSALGWGCWNGEYVPTTLEWSVSGQEITKKTLNENERAELVGYINAAKEAVGYDAMLAELSTDDDTNASA